MAIHCSGPLPPGRSPRIVAPATHGRCAGRRIAHTVASHRSAALLDNLDGVRGETVEVTAARWANNRNVGGVVIHRSSLLEDVDLDEVDNIPVTTVTRTLIDLGAVSEPESVEMALESGLRTGRTGIRFLNQRLGVIGGKSRPGTATLRKVLAGQLYEAPTGSLLETRFVQLCGRFGLAPGTRQNRVSGGGQLALVDFAWPQSQLPGGAGGLRAPRHSCGPPPRHAATECRGACPTRLGGFALRLG